MSEVKINCSEFDLAAVALVVKDECPELQVEYSEIEPGSDKWELILKGHGPDEKGIEEKVRETFNVPVFYVNVNIDDDFPLLWDEED